MGEILRAVLDQSCKFSNPAFYNMECGPYTGAGQVDTKVTYLECKTDRYFLVTGLAQSRFSQVTGMFDNGRGEYQIKILRTGRILYQDPLKKLLVGQDMSQMLTLPEYVLLHPNETIELTISALTRAVNPMTYMLTLAGIEYAP